MEPERIEAASWDRHTPAAAAQVPAPSSAVPAGQQQPARFQPAVFGFPHDGQGVNVSASERKQPLRDRINKQIQRCFSGQGAIVTVL